MVLLSAMFYRLFSYCSRIRAFLHSGEVYSCIRKKYMSVFRRTVCGSGVCLIIFRTFYHRRGDLSNFGEKRGMPHWFRNENCGHKRSINCDMKNVSIHVDPMRERLHEQRTEKPGQCRNCTVRAAGCIYKETERELLPDHPEIRFRRWRNSTHRSGHPGSGHTAAAASRPRACRRSHSRSRPVCWNW